MDAEAGAVVPVAVVEVPPAQAAAAIDNRIVAAVVRARRGLGGEVLVIVSVPSWSERLRPCKGLDPG
jgi:hypothetical protein